MAGVKRTRAPPAALGFARVVGATGRSPLQPFQIRRKPPHSIAGTCLQAGPVLRIMRLGRNLCASAGRGTICLEEESRFRWVEIGDAVPSPVTFRPAPKPAEVEAEPRLRLQAVVGEEGTFAAPTGIWADIFGNLYVADTGHVQIQKITPAGDAYLLRCLGKEMLRPVAVAVDSALQIYVCDSQNHTIIKFGAQGHYERTFGFAGTQPSFLNAPAALWVDRMRNVYVADSGNDRVEVYDARGRFLWHYEGRAPAAAFSTPSGVAVTPEGNVWVSDSAQGHLVLLTSRGGAGRRVDLRRALDLPVVVPGHLWATDDGGVLVCDPANSAVWRVRPEGGVELAFPREALAGLHRLRRPTGVAQDPEGRIYICDTEQACVLILGV